MSAPTRTAAPSDALTGYPPIELRTPAPPVAAPASKQLYDPRELDEQVDLPVERRKQILDLFYRLPTLDYYAALGLPLEADKKQIRTAYFALSRAFHPDSMFRKELGSFKAKMSAVFQYLTEGYDILSKKKTRDEYDAYLRSTRSIEQAERALATDEVAVADANVEVPRPPLLPSTDFGLPPQTPLPDAPREPSADARRIARELLERRLRGGAMSQAERRPAAAPPSPAVSEPPPAGSSTDRQQIARQLTRTLIDVGRTSGNSDRLTRALGTAKAAFERGDLAQAVQHMARALALAPERSDIHSEYERLSRMLARSVADAYTEQAKFEVKQGKWGSAAISWSKVCEGRPDDAAAHRAAALSLLKAGGDMRGAQKYAQRAVHLAPTDIDARLLLAQIHLTVGLKLNAKRELDMAAKLDPENEMVKNLISELKA
jgi:curved DNA-binding protein CbpA